MISKNTVRCLLIVFITVPAGARLLYGDVLPTGHKSVRHQLVFEPSPLFDNYRMVAAPMTGFAGLVEVEPGKRFSFSTKYGTRFYLIPDHVTKLENYDRERFEKWPHTTPPVGEIRSVPVSSPVESALTTLEFADVRDGRPVINVVRHVKLDRHGKPASYWRAYRWLAVPILAGIVVLWAAIVGIRRLKRIRSGNAAGDQ